MNKKHINLETLESKHKGLKGFFEKTLRRFKIFTQIAIMIPMYFVGCLLFGLSAVPAIWVFKYITGFFNEGFLGLFSIGFAISFGYFVFGFTMIFVTPIMNFIIRGYLKPWRGPYYSFEAVIWFLHNGLTYMPRFTFLNFITPSPLANLFYKMMGMKIGNGTIINTVYISDPSLITLGKKVTLGGSVTLVAHYGQSGLLVISPLVIGDNCTIGLKSSVMGGVTIGNNVKILPHSVVMPKTHIPDNETWGGVPAVKINIEKMKEPISNDVGYKEISDEITKEDFKKSS